MIPIKEGTGQESLTPRSSGIFCLTIQTLTIYVCSVIVFVRRFIAGFHLMHISLTPELESRVRSRVESGLYNNASEVIREALRFMESHQAWVEEIKLATLRGQLQIGIGQLDDGQGNNIQSKKALDALMEEIKR